MALQTSASETGARDIFQNTVRDGEGKFSNSYYELIENA
jgi:hypothetical protein